MSANLKPAVPPFMSTDSATRKLMPVASGVLAYFPDALMCVSWISRVGNEKHNAGEPLHWAKEKSSDEPDAEVRHMLDFVRGLPPDPGLEPLGDLGHLASKAWRALAHLQRACDQAREDAELKAETSGSFEVTIDGVKHEGLHSFVYEEKLPSLAFRIEPPTVPVAEPERPAARRVQIGDIIEHPKSFKGSHVVKGQMPLSVWAEQGWFHADGAPIAAEPDELPEITVDLDEASKSFVPYWETDPFKSGAV